MTAATISDLDYWKKKLIDCEKPFDFRHFCNLAIPGRATRRYRPEPAISLKILLAAKHNEMNSCCFFIAALSLILDRYFQDKPIALPIAGFQLTPDMPAKLLYLKLFLSGQEKETASFSQLMLRIYREWSEGLDYVLYEDEEGLPSVTDAELSFVYTPLGKPVSPLAAKIGLTVERIGAELILSMDYDRLWIPDFIAEGLLSHMDAVLRQAADDPGRSLKEFDILGEEETRRLSRDGSGPLHDYPDDKSLATLFRDQALATPGNTALVFGETRLSYQDLDRVSDKLCHYLLQTSKIPARSLIGIVSDNSPFAIIAILATLKARCIFIPIDTRHGKGRLLETRKDSACRLLLAEEKDRELLSGLSDVAFIDLASLPDPEVPPEDNTNGKDLVYCMYTSGTTGKSLGALIYHYSVSNHIVWFKRTFDIRNVDSTMLFTTFSFDGSMTIIWAALTAGATLHIAADPVFHPGQLVKYMQQQGITFIKTPPSVFSALVNTEEFSRDGFGVKFRAVKLGGAPVDTAPIRTFLSKHPASVIGNHYGITETSIGSTFIFINENNVGDLDRFQLIGRPYDNIRAYILDPSFRPLPIGYTGEIFIAGEGVGAGYLNNPVITAQKFIPDPFFPGRQMYRTGDFGRRHPDGAIEFLFRRDHEVKINGFRINLEEINARLRQDPQVKDCVTLKRKNDSGELDLVTFVAATVTDDGQDLLNQLREMLPPYMAPSRLLLIKNIPLMLNGKLDMAALEQKMDAPLTTTTDTIIGSAENTTRKTLLAVWKELLGHGQFDSDTNFFRVGGNSLRVIQLATRVNKLFGTSIAMKQFFSDNTITLQESRIQANATGKSITMIPLLKEEEYYGLSHAQKRLWLAEQDQAGKGTAYNIAHAFLLQGSLDPEMLDEAFSQLLLRHDSLRTVFPTVKGQPVQKILRAVRLTPTWYNWEEEDNAPSPLSERLDILAAAPFDLANGPLVKINVFRLGSNRLILQLIIHHIICDGWSLRILLRDLLTFYEASEKGAQPSLPPLPIQYKDYAAWHTSHLDDKKGKAGLDFWKDLLQEKLPLVRVPADFDRPGKRSWKGDLYSCTIPRTVIQPALQAVKEENRPSLALALFAALLYHYTGQKDLIIGFPAAGRITPELEDQVGFYINTLPLRIRLSGTDSFRDLAANCMTSIRAALDHESYPLDLIIESVRLPKGRTGLFDVTVSCNNIDFAMEDMSRFGTASIESIGYRQRSSKFDLSFHFFEQADNIQLTFEYNTDILTERRIHTYTRHLQELIRQAGAYPDRPLQDLEILDASERAVIDTLNAALPATGATLRYYDDFFTMGGDTASAALAVEKLNARLNAGLSLSDIYQFPNGYLLTDYIKRNRQEPKGWTETTNNKKRREIRL